MSDGPSVPILAPGIGTRIGVVAARLGVRKIAYKVAGVSSATLQRYIAGESAPAFDAMARLCVSAGVRMEWLATGEGPMLVSEVAPLSHSQAARPDLGRLVDALALIDQALALTHRSADREARAKLAVMAYDVLGEEDSVADALRRIMTAVESNTQGVSHGQEG